LKYPVFCAKLHAFKNFNLIVTALFNKEMKTLKERQELLRMALSMNITTNRKQERIDLLWSKLGIFEPLPAAAAQHTLAGTISPGVIGHGEKEISYEFISGVIDGDGSFYISFEQNGLIIPYFTITNDIFSLSLLECIQKQFKGIGSISKVKDRNAIRYKIMSLNEIIETLIPIIDTYPLLSERNEHYQIFRKVCFMLNNTPKNNKDLNFKLELVDLAYESNKKGKRRKLTKLEYISLLNNLHSKPS
jgi:hypothetical protein